MKASLKFREDEKPLFRAKVPLSILGLPFQSGLAAGNSKELSLTLGTLFGSGPAFRIAYRPNDSSKPFSLLLKTGIGSLGSPVDAPITMTAEFNLAGGPRSTPSFFLHFKPRVGDFFIRKSQSSYEIAHRVNSRGRGGGGREVSSEDEGSVEVVNPPSIGGSKLTELAARSTTSLAAGVDTALDGMELGARTVLPIRNGAVLKLRWGVRFPEDFKSLFTKPTAGISSHGIPLLVMNKIAISHVEKDDSSREGPGGSLKGGNPADVMDTCFAVRRQLEGLQAESERTRKAMEDFKSQFACRGPNNSATNAVNDSTSVRGGGRKNSGGRKEAEGNQAADEPKRVLKVATGD